MNVVRSQSRQSSDNTQIRRHRPDYWLIVIAVFLVAIGLTVVYAIGPALSATKGGSGTYFVSRQMIAIALSAAAFFVTARIPLHTWGKWQKPLLVLAGIGTLLALVTPKSELYPAHRWIRLGSFSLQSVEILKFALIIALAGFFAARVARGELGSTERTLKPLGITILALMAVVASPEKLHGQSDLGSMAVIIAFTGAMAVVAGMPMRRIALIAAAVVLVVVFVISISPYRRARLTSFTHPDCMSSSGYQACQALIAVGSGGIGGLGLGRSVQAYGYLPEAQNDSIFAIYAEKFGFIGVMVLLGLFVALFARLRLIIERTPDVFSRLVVVGVLAWLSTQMIINVGAMVGLLPLKGITLPLVSYGGTSVLFVGAALGLVFQISHYTSFSSRNVQKSGGQRIYDEDSDDRRRIRRAYHPDSSGRS
ncbi:MAG TPA: putative peptidoglycan glycosyltransferase FtsW [Candidatus Saccharimonadia bacterium]|nr:putative peptidoglycan glycosyltransferase FtsW [Candidatus Saccharimonadia bacterium]